MRPLPDLCGATLGQRGMDPSQRKGGKCDMGMQPKDASDHSKQHQWRDKSSHECAKNPSQKGRQHLDHRSTITEGGHEAQDYFGKGQQPRAGSGSGTICQRQ